jgi:hypothetical protein
MASWLPVDGEGDPWECRVEFANFESFANLAAGGAFTLDPGSPKYLMARKKSPPEIDALRRSFDATYPLYRTSDSTAYPSLELVNVDATASIPLVPLRDALAFAAPAVAEQDPDTRLSTCTITPAGDVTTYSRHVFFRAAALPISFEANLTSPNAGRLVRWLTLLGSMSSAELVVLVAGRNDQGRACLEFRTPDGDHAFRLMTARRPVPVEFVDEASAGPVAVRGMTDGSRLVEIAGCFGYYTNPLKGTFVRGRQGWSLQMVPTDDESSGFGEVKLEACQAEDERAAGLSFLVPAAQLLSAVTRHRPGQLLLEYRPETRTLSFVDGSDGGVYRSGPGRQSLLRVAPSQCTRGAAG